jgi:protein-tyrosine phosphatase
VVDIHCHLLPGVDDGAPDLEASVAMARAAVDGGVKVVVATPHVSGTYPTDPGSLARRVGEVRDALEAAGVGLEVLQGAEISLSQIGDLDEEALAACALGEGGRYLLLEPPYRGPAPFLDRLVFDLGVRGYRVVLAHPERISAFQSDVDFLERLVGQGAICSVTAGSVAGQFGRTVKQVTEEMLRRGLVHNLASDAHDAKVRSPALRPTLERAVAEVPELERWLDWMTVDVPAAVVAGEAVPGEAPRLEVKRGLLDRLRRR